MLAMLSKIVQQYLIIKLKRFQQCIAHLNTAKQIYTPCLFFYNTSKRLPC